MAAARERQEVLYREVDCARCDRAFPAVLTDGRCPQCQTVAPREEWGDSIYGPFASAWYRWLGDPRKVIAIVMVLAILAMLLLGYLIIKYD